MITCLTCGFSHEDAKFMEDHCKYLGHLGYLEEGKKEIEK